MKEEGDQEQTINLVEAGHLPCQSLLHPNGNMRDLGLPSRCKADVNALKGHVYNVAGVFPAELLSEWTSYSSHAEGMFSHARTLPSTFDLIKDTLSFLQAS